jgi:acyl-CoA hydrolase
MAQLESEHVRLMTLDGGVEMYRLVVRDYVQPSLIQYAGSVGEKPGRTKMSEPLDAEFLRSALATAMSGVAEAARRGAIYPERARAAMATRLRPAVSADQDARDPQPVGTTVANDSREPGTTRAVLTYRMGVRDANPAGDVHGGWIMKLCDDVAVIAAARHAKSRVVTLAVDGLLFRSPVHVSDVVTLRAAVNAAWRTSMEVGVRVEAEDVRGGEARHTLTAYLTLVALDGEGETRTVPPFVPSTPEDQRRWREANARRAIRLADPHELVRLHKIPPSHEPD